MWRLSLGEYDGTCYITEGHAHVTLIPGCQFNLIEENVRSNTGESEAEHQLNTFQIVEAAVFAVLSGDSD